MKQKVPIVLSIAALVGVIYVLDGVNLPSQSRLWRELMNAGHAPLFGVLSFAMLVLSRAWLLHLTRPWYHYYVAATASAFIGVATEFVQYFTPRDASVLDMVYNVVGIISFLACAATFDRYIHGHSHLRGLLGRNLVRFLALLLFSTAFISFGTVVMAHAHRKSQFPVILDFESFLDKSFLNTSFASVDFVAPPPEWKSNSSSRVGKWTLLPNRLSAITVHYPSPVWNGYEYLQLDLFSMLQSPTTVSLRINDVLHNFEFIDRYNTSLSINPGLNHISIPLAEIENAPKDRKMDMSSISNIILFSSGVEQRRFFFLDNLTLK